MNLGNARKVVSIVRDAGGEVIGRTRLQKTVYLLERVGYGEGFAFRYRNYGPFSDELASATRTAVLFGELQESNHIATWGGTYSIYRVDPMEHTDNSTGRSEFARRAANAGSIELELAATAVFLTLEGHDDPWAETKRRKPQKSDDGRLKGAKDLLASLREFEVPKPLPCFS